RNSPEAHNITIGCKIDGEAFIKGNSRQVRQVFWNLFLNASHAMEDGGLLSVTLGHIKGFDAPSGLLDIDDPDASLVEIIVTDTGIGVEADKVSSIFDPFYSTKDSGSGLGLAIVYRIVKSLGGTIDVLNTAKQGMTFRLLIPEFSEESVSSAVGVG
ncbi:MAG: HAMP domain-containing histidine kinase, partial [Proteobacteria bacterium]|nr:HAMP domain-containing histidine kinase [Pseudomonadota bacterium]